MSIVCLCGSSRWPELHHQAIMEETLAGNIVIPMGLYGHADYPPGAKSVTNDADESVEVKQMLDRMHFQKIDMASQIVVVSLDGYIGSSTRREIEYAILKGKLVRYWNKESDNSQTRKITEELLGRISNYLQAGGFFNPECMEHDKVRDLLIDCRDHLLKTV